MFKFGVRGPVNSPTGYNLGHVGQKRLLIKENHIICGFLHQAGSMTVLHFNDMLITHFRHKLRSKRCHSLKDRV